MVDWPPAFVFNQGRMPASFEDLGDGQFDHLFQELAQRLPEFAHRPERVNSVRLWHFMGEGLTLSAAPRPSG